MSTPNEPILCSFCGRNEASVDKLIAGPSAYICDKCIVLCGGILEKKQTPSIEVTPLKPKEIKSELDQYIIGQELAKRTISVAVYNHYKKMQSSNCKDAIEFNKSNVMLLGPTGSGKTLIAKTLARILDVPFAIVDATTLTEAGYVGEDVENIVLRLVQAADYDVAKTERGIIYVDEIDKITRTTANVSITRDVSGEGVQQALLKIIEGTVASVPPKGGRKHPSTEYININTENILFIVGGAFNNLEKVIARRLGKSTIGFNQSQVESIDTSEISNLLSQVETEDLIQYGLIPEFIGRFSCIVNLNQLKIGDLVTILTGPKNSIINQYIALFEQEGVKLSFTDEALDAIAEKALKAATGARALRMILENLMRDLMYEIPSDPTVEEVLIEKETVLDLAPPVIRRTEDKKIA